MTTRAFIKQRAYENFKGNYWLCVGLLALYCAIAAVAGAVTFGVGTLLLVPPLAIGYNYCCLCIYRGLRPTVDTLFQSGFTGYGRKLGGYLWMELFIYLWSLLFVIPGIIKALAYSMTPYLLADHPNIQATDAIKISMKITQGYKGEIFVMYLSFIGWLLLCSLTFGILFFFHTGPYLYTSFAGQYEELKAKDLADGRITPEELEGIRAA